MEATIATETKENETMSEATTVKKAQYRDDKGKMISLDAAKACRWARVEDGQPTKIYELRLAKRAAIKAGEEVPIREKATYAAGSQSHAEVPSPYDLNRRSGYRVIWQVLAEHVNEAVSREFLETEVRERLQAEAPEWYNARYSEVPYDVWANTIVINRAPYNEKIEAMRQRVSINDANTEVTLMTDVTEARVAKKRGRKPKAAVEPTTVEPASDDEATVEQSVETVVEATA